MEKASVQRNSSLNSFIDELQLKSPYIRQLSITVKAWLHHNQSTYMFLPSIDLWPHRQSVGRFWLAEKSDLTVPATGGKQPIAVVVSGLGRSIYIFHLRINCFTAWQVITTKWDYWFQRKIQYRCKWDICITSSLKETSRSQILLNEEKKNLFYMLSFLSIDLRNGD